MAIRQASRYSIGATPTARLNRSRASSYLSYENGPLSWFVPTLCPQKNSLLETSKWTRSFTIRVKFRRLFASPQESDHAHSPSDAFTGIEQPHAFDRNANCQPIRIPPVRSRRPQFTLAPFGSLTLPLMLSRFIEREHAVAIVVCAAQLVAPATLARCRLDTRHTGGRVGRHDPGVRALRCSRADRIAFMCRRRMTRRSNPWIDAISFE